MTTHVPSAFVGTTFIQKRRCRGKAPHVPREVWTCSLVLDLRSDTSMLSLTYYICFASCVMPVDPLFPFSCCVRFAPGYFAGISLGC